MSSHSSVRIFLDTNILVYSDDQFTPAKQKRALKILDEQMSQRTGVVSTQVLQEYFVTVTRKLNLDAKIARRKVEIFAGFAVAQPAVGDILAAIDLHRLNNISFWDALILRAAKQAGCRILFSEDMQHMQIIDGIQIVNPFIECE